MGANPIFVFRLARTKDGFCNVGRRRIWTRMQSPAWATLDSDLITLGQARHSIHLGRSPYPVRNPQAPAGTMARAVDNPKGESRTGHQPGRTRVSGRRTTGPDASLCLWHKSLGYVRLHTTPSPGMLRMQALRWPGPGSTSCTRREEGLLETRGLKQAWPSRRARTPNQDHGRKPLSGPGLKMEGGGAGGARREAGRHIRRHALRRLVYSGSPRDVECMQPGRSRGNQLPGRLWAR